LYKRLVEDKVVPVLNQHHPLNTYDGVEVHLHSFLTSALDWRWVVSFTYLPLYPQEKRSRYPLDRRLGGPQNRSALGSEEKNSLHLPGIEPRSSNCFDSHKKM